MTIQIVDETLAQQIEQIAYHIQRPPEEVIFEAIHLYMQHLRLEFQNEADQTLSAWQDVYG